MLAPGTVPAWHVELHQFRIEAAAGEYGLPAPEGIHRDGVDGAFVMLICRSNVVSGTTQIFDPQGAPLGSFTLTDPGDAVFLDDARVFHGVTPVTPLEDKTAVIRDVLAITFTRKTHAHEP
ncbi:2OG-Fe dioxygenase family protein [Bradyrhizobium diazoefficiens]|uniref:2OG-Fe dioxygenase family protein n=1 Tax=Bradyrhizobium diazoefficiens TaxID=1355477 RepID=UPI00190CB702|nr:2OG-Fe dioxygenase family protein [Bradyrhizobium diazoefficiens]QQO35535.1 2OG-Fe dioxygenase family protein [Bradyrhizobium diazoefficiens]